MPLGRTHDRITLWTLPFVTLAAGWMGGSHDALAVGGSYLFAGLMFAGDLDTYSRQYQRWLWLRWIWLPYQKLCRHRSMWSHGPVVGTLVRLLYLGLWLGILGGLVLGLGRWLGWWQEGIPWTELQLWFGQRWRTWIGIGIGLELGSFNHSLSDHLGSAWKRRHRGQQQSQGCRPRSSKS